MAVLGGWDRMPASGGGWVNAVSALSEANRRATAAQRGYDNTTGRAIGGAAGGAGAVSGTGGGDRISTARDKVFGLGESQLKELRGDPVDALVLAELQKRAQGGGPYDETTRNAMFTAASEQAAASQAAQAGRLQGNPADPSYQAALRSLNDARAQQLQQARLGIDLTANRANYAAQGENLAALGDFRYRQNQQVTDASRYLGGLYAQEQQTSYGPMPGAPMATRAPSASPRPQATQPMSGGRSWAPSPLIGAKPKPLAPTALPATQPQKGTRPVSYQGYGGTPAPAAEQARSYPRYDMTGYGGTPAPASAQARGDGAIRLQVADSRTPLPWPPRIL